MTDSLASEVVHRKPKRIPCYTGREAAMQCLLTIGIRRVQDDIFYLHFAPASFWKLVTILSFFPALFYFVLKNYGVSKQFCHPRLGLCRSPASTYSLPSRTSSSHDVDKNQTTSRPGGGFVDLDLQEAPRCSR